MESQSTHPTEVQNVTYNNSQSIDESDQPVIKIDFRGRIIYANRASFELLNEWLRASNEYIPDYFLKVNPGILNPDADFSVPFRTKAFTINFDVIGFKECGYIGLYGYQSGNFEEEYNSKTVSEILN